MLPRIGDRLPDPQSLRQIFIPVRPQQRDVAVQLGVCRVNIAEDLCLSGVCQLLIAADVDPGALLLALVAVENAQGDAYADTQRLDSIWVVVRRVVRVPAAE